MGKFIAVHPVDPPVNKDVVVPIAKKAKAGLSMEAYWVKSWLKLNDKGEVAAVYCEWDGKDAKSVRDALTKSILNFHFPKYAKWRRYTAKISDS